MNDHTDPWETEMSREFDQRVRDLHEAPLTLDQVKGKAGPDPANPQGSPSRAAFWPPRP